MNFFKLIIILVFTNISYAQVYIVDSDQVKTYENVIFQANTTGNEIKGFKFPRKTLTGRTDYLTTITNKDTNMLNSMLIYNNKESELSKGLYFWESDRWNNLLDDSYKEKLSQVYLAITKNSEKTYSFSTTTTDSSTDTIRVGMNYDSNIFTDLYNETTNLNNKFTIVNAENILKIKSTGIIQLDNVENVPVSKIKNFNQASIGMGLFVKHPGKEEFKLIAYSVIRAHITSSCTKFPFTVFEYEYNLKPTGPSEYYEVKIAFDKRDFSLLNGNNGAIQVSLGASDSPNCINSNPDSSYSDSRSFIPKQAAITFLTTEIFEIVH